MTYLISELISVARAMHYRKRSVYWGVAHTFLFLLQHFVGLEEHILVSGGHGGGGWEWSSFGTKLPTL